MDNRVVSVIASKKRRKKKKPRPDTLPNLPEIPVGVSTSTPVNDQTHDNPNSSVLTIPQLTVTPPEDDGNPCHEIYAPPEVVNILSQSSSRRKKKKKKQPVLPVVKDEVRPSVVLGYTPRSLCKSVIVQPTVSELEEVCEEAEEDDCLGNENLQRFRNHNSVSQPVLELAEETSELLEEVSINCSESAYGSAESGRSSRISDATRSPGEGPEHINHFQEQIAVNDSESACCVSQSTSFNAGVKAHDSISTSSCSSSDFVSANCTYNASSDLSTPIELKSDPLFINGTTDNFRSAAADELCANRSVSDSTLVDNSTSSFESASRSVGVTCPELKLTSKLHPHEVGINTCASVHNHFSKSQDSCSKTSFGADESKHELVIGTFSATVSEDQVDSCGPKHRAEFCPPVIEAMPEVKQDGGQKTKAQLKAERKLAFEAQRAQAANSNPPAAGEDKAAAIEKPDGTQKNKKQPKPDKKTAANVVQKEPEPSAASVTPPATSDGAQQQQQKTKEQLKAERKAAFEAQKGAQIAAQKSQNAQKSKADLRAERRAIQESQRASKETGKEAPSAPALPGQGKPETLSAHKKSPIQPLTIADPTVKKQAATKVPQDKELSTEKMHLFSHLPQFQWDSSITSKLGLSGKVIHPAIIRSGLRMAQGLVSGSDARCVATLAAFREVIQDYKTPPQKELSRDLDSKVKLYADFLKKCRPLSVSMINAIKELRRNITQIPSNEKDAEAKKQLVNGIDVFVEEQIVLAKKAIADDASKKIHDNDVILIYGCSPLVKQVLSEAQDKSKKFKVIVVDAKPGLDGREMVKYLVGKKIECSYVLINAVSYVMKEVKLVLLDCHSLQANGYVMSRVGSSQIALVAQASNVPVLVCCETYKFWDRVHTDAFVDNELGNPEELVTQMPKHRSHLENWKEMPHLNLVNITYDVTPADLVTAVITEIGTLPCTSVPAVLRVKHRDNQNNQNENNTKKN